MVLNISKLPSLEFANNFCKGNFARGVLVKTRNVYIHDNTFEDIMGSAICVYAERSWREGTFSGDVRIENNIIRRCEHLNPEGSVGGIEIGIHTDEKAAEPQIRNVSITGNIIECPGTKDAILADGVDGLTVRGNTNLCSENDIELTNCTNVDILQ